MINELNIYSTLNEEKYIIDREGSAKLTGYASVDMPWLKYYSEEAIKKELPQNS